jgi:hypothetical protein
MKYVYEPEDMFEENIDKFKREFEEKETKRWVWSKYMDEIWESGGCTMSAFLDIFLFA